MSFLGKPNGLFLLNESDKNVGSFIRKCDVCEILKIKEKDLNRINFLDYFGEKVIDELLLQKLWQKNEIKNSLPNKKRNAKISLDELILINLIKQAYPNIEIEHQFKWGRKSIDFKLNLENKNTIFIEFEGPHHFLPSKYNSNPKNPLIRKKEIEDCFGIECIIWPYWIQKCVLNVKSLFEKNINGLGAIWSANVFFNNFAFNNSAEIIEEISSKFKIKRENSYGYIYEGNNENRIKPEHPILKKIRNKKKGIEILLPKGFKNKSLWIPKEFS